MTNDPQDKDIVNENSLSALLAHFRRSGVQFLPSADQNRVQQLTSQSQASVLPIQLPPAAEKTGSSVSPVAAATSSSPTPSPRSRFSPVPVSHAVSAPKLESYAGPSLPVVERASRLNEIAGEVASCDLCQVLASSRKHTVPGEGNPAARVCFLGEAPGADEDASGMPFVGRAGQLLTKMIEACTFSRDDVFILNTVKCHPPGNRNPAHDEVENCRGYLERQLDIIQPEYIVCLGLVAAQTLLHSKLSIGRLRNQFHAYRGSKVLVTYHPSYLLREPEVKKAAWADLQFLLRDMGIELPRK